MRCFPLLPKIVPQSFGLLNFPKQDDSSCRKKYDLHFRIFSNYIYKNVTKKNQEKKSRIYKGERTILLQQDLSAGETGFCYKKTKEEKNRFIKKIHYKNQYNARERTRPGQTKQTGKKPGLIFSNKKNKKK